jgi:chromosome segregation ATPase
MSQEVVQWLNEIKTLQQQVADLQGQLAEANDSGDRWRARYDAEAQQHRTALTQSQSQLSQAQSQLSQAQNPVNPETLTIDSATSARLDRLTPEGLKQKLIEIWAERDQMEFALKAERIAHDQTRKDLTTALADAMEVLSKAKRNVPQQVFPDLGSDILSGGRLDDVIEG